MMTPEQATLVQQTFALVVPVADEAAETFYRRLFDVAPAVKPLFHGDMAEQRRKLMVSLAVVVRGLSDLPSILPAASALAKRHVNYARSRNIIRWSERHCSGRWRAHWGPGGLQRSRRHGRPPIRRCPRF
jgi:hypothetical protein